MSKSKALIIAALALGVTSGVNAQQQPAPPQLPTHATQAEMGVY